MVYMRITGTINYEEDARSFSECLKDFALVMNGGQQYGARQVASLELRVPLKTLSGWMDGRKCSHEMSFRRFMTLLVKT